MEGFISNFNKLLPYFFIFPIFLLIVVILLKIISKKNINDNNFYLFGVFINLTNKDILLICLLLIQFFFIISSLFINDVSYYLIIFLLLPVVVFCVLCKYYIQLIDNIVLTLFVFVLIIFKDVFYLYLKDVTTLWYVELIYVVLLLSIFVLAIFILIFNFNKVIKNKKLKDLK